MVQKSMQVNPSSGCVYYYKYTVGNTSVTIVNILLKTHGQEAQAAGAQHSGAVRQIPGGALRRQVEGRHESGGSPPPSPPPRGSAAWWGCGASHTPLRLRLEPREGNQCIGTGGEGTWVRSQN